MKIIRVGVDLAKNVFQVHCVDQTEKPVWQRKLKRDEWIKTLLEKIEPGCVIGMEACGGAHHWARMLEAKGYTVRLMAPQFVKPYVQSISRAMADRLTAMSQLLFLFVIAGAPAV